MAALDDALKRTYFATSSPEYLNTDTFKADLADHVTKRFGLFSSSVVPWIKRHVGDISRHLVVEIGSGTGSSTAAIAPHVGRIDTFEINERSVVAAEARAKILGYSNVSHHRCLFDAKQAAKLAPLDGVFLAAVLEHCTLDEPRPA